MAVKDGLPATDFSRMNREYINAVAEAAGGGGGGGGIPAPENPSDGDVLTYDSTDEAWVAAAPSGGNANILWLTEDDATGELSETYATIESAMESGTIVIIKFVFETGCVFMPVFNAAFNGDNYEVSALDYGATEFPICMTYVCAAATDYPALE